MYCLSDRNITAEMADSSGAVAPLDTDLCLIDSHPTIDLMSVSTNSTKPFVFQVII